MTPHGELECGKSPVELMVVRMDTKRNQTEGFKKQAALNVKSHIETWKPDVVIASDYNASKYLIVPYFKDKELPFVFCGVNWDASVYGFPCSNVTGMEEVTFVPQTIAILKKYAKGDRIGVIAADSLSERKTVTNVKKKFDLNFDKVYFSRTFDDWKRHFIRLQSEVDMILFPNPVGISDWDSDAAKEVVAAQIEVPIGTMDEWVVEYAVIALTKSSSEQGEWAAQTALRILNGASPMEIPVVQNSRVKLLLNRRLAKKLGIVFPVEIRKLARFID